VIRTAKTDVCLLCVAFARTHGREFEISTNAMQFWKSGFEFAYRRNKKARLFEFLRTVGDTNMAARGAVICDSASAIFGGVATNMAKVAL
jgi:hypothetical protein